MERKKRSKGRGWESCYVKKIYGTFGVEMRAYGRNWSNFANTHARARARVSYRGPSSIDMTVDHNSVGGLRVLIVVIK